MPSKIGTLQRELLQRLPFRSPSQEAALDLIRTADDVRRYLASAMEPFGITFHQYNALRILRGAGEEGLPTMELAERMIERTPGVTRMMDRLDLKGLAVRARLTGDRRRIICRITPAGLELLERMDEAVGRADDTVLDMLSEEEIRTLVSLLDTIRAARS